MADRMTPERRSWMMSRINGKNGGLELLMQRKLRRSGFRFSLHCTDLAGTPDIVFRRERVVVFVDGDFWHGWRLPAWEHKLTDFWRSKLHANRRRDRRNFSRLRAAQWKVVRIWEHEIRLDVDSCVARIRGAISAPRINAVLLHRRVSNSRTRGRSPMR